MYLCILEKTTHLENLRRAPSESMLLLALPKVGGKGTP